MSCRTWLGAVHRDSHAGVLGLAGGAAAGEFRRVPRHRRASPVSVSMTHGTG